MKKFFKSSVATALMFALAILLLSVGTIGGTQAALQRFSNLYQGQISMKNIGVTLIENGEDISWRNYSTTEANDEWTEETGNLIQYIVEKDNPGDKAFKIGKNYNFALQVRNSGSIDQYVRVTIYKYFVDPSGQRITDTSVAGQSVGWFYGNGTKQLNIDPSRPYPTDNNNNPLELINIELANTGDWIEDESSSTPERTVLYYNKVLSCEEGQNTTPAFTSTLTVSSDVTKLYTKITNEDGSTSNTSIYAMDGLGVVVEVQVDAVQTRHAEDAKTSAWGYVV